MPVYDFAQSLVYKGEYLILFGMALYCQGRVSPPFPPHCKEYRGGKQMLESSPFLPLPNIVLYSRHSHLSGHNILNFLNTIGHLLTLLEGKGVIIVLKPTHRSQDMNRLYLA